MVSSSIFLQRGKSKVPRTALLLALLVSLSGCDRKQTAEDSAESELKELPLLEPLAQRGKEGKHCVISAATRWATLRAQGGRESVVEVGEAVPVAGGFAVSILESGAQAEAAVFWTNGRGREQWISLGRVHGAVEAPLLAVHGKTVIAAVMDSDASQMTLRLIQITGLEAQVKLVRGPEVLAQRDESQGLDLLVFKGDSAGAGLLVWDHFDKSSSRSQIRALSFSAATMKAEGREFAISSPELDVVSPRLAAGEQGVFLSWLRYGKMPKIGALGATDSGGLIEEPPRQLEALMLRVDGRVLQAARPLSEPGKRVSAYDLTVHKSDLIVAYRGNDVDGQLGDVPINLLRLGPDGAVHRGAAGHSLLGPGAPLLLGQEAEEPWLAARGQDQELLLARISEVSSGVELQPETELSGKIPLTRAGSRLLTMRSEGINLKLGAADCFLKPKSTKKAQETK